VLLDGKNAVIYGGAGAIGRAVARGFAREGAKVHLAGRTLERVERVAEEIRAAGGAAEAAQVDALDERSVDDHAAAMVAGAGSVDISINVISLGEIFGSPLAEARLMDFERPVMTAVRTTFLTTRAAARRMIRQRSGVILTFGGYGKPISDFYLGGFQIGLSAVDALRRQLAAELGPYGIRVLTLQSTGVVPETIPEDHAGREHVTDEIVSRTLLKRGATLEDVGNVAAFAASDNARAITATALNITCGDEVD
jgi:3-oxoacyl-[acyl-carrier protein] reductase